MGDCTSERKFETEGSIYHVERLHNVPYLTDECCDLINMEWKRSHVARIRSIGNSVEDFPMSLVLLRNTDNPKVVGHCKISKLGLSDSKVFVETVVIHPELRGKGLGKFLMSEVENVCRSKNIRWIYLSTEDKKVFYEKLGYTKCLPVSIYGCDLNNSFDNINQVKEKVSAIGLNSGKKSNFPTRINTSPPAPAPPPPPPPPKLPPPDNLPSKTYLKKEIIYE